MSQALTLRVMRLEALEAIRSLKARYSAIADAKYTAAYTRVEPWRMRELAADQAACFAEQAVWFGGEFGGDRVGRKALAEWFEHSPWRWAAHYYQSPDISIEPCLTKASGTWLLWQLALRADTGEAVFLTATTDESYVLENQQWLIQSMRFTQLNVMPAAAGPLPIYPNLQQLDAAIRV